MKRILTLIGSVLLAQSAMAAGGRLKDYGRKEYVRVSKDLPHLESVPWRLICTMPYDCDFQPSVEIEADKLISFNSTNPLVLYLTNTESVTKKPAIPEILKALVQTAEPLLPVNWADPLQLAPDLLAAVKTPSPADTMFSGYIRMGAFKVLTKYHFKEAIPLGVELAKTQGRYGSEKRTGEIVKLIPSYGTAAREVVAGLRELIVVLNEQCAKGEFPKGELNDMRVNAVEDAIKSIEAATTQPELRSIGATPGSGGKK